MNKKEMNEKTSTLKSILEEAIKSPGKNSMFVIAEGMDMEVGEVVDTISESTEEIQKLYTRYQNLYKNYLLRYAMDEKVKDLFLPLLKEVGAVNADDSGNDLELNLIVNANDKLKIENVSRETLEKEEEEEWEEN